MIQMAPQNMTLWVQFSFSKTGVGVSSNPRLHQYIDSCIFCINVTFRCPFFVQITELTFCKVYKRPIISSFCVTSDLCSWITGIFEMFSQNNTSNITGQSAAACCFFPLLQLLLLLQQKTCIFTDNRRLWLSSTWPVKYLHAINTWTRKPNGLHRDLRGLKTTKQQDLKKKTKPCEYVSGTLRFHFNGI